MLADRQTHTDTLILTLRHPYQGGVKIWDHGIHKRIHHVMLEGAKPLISGQGWGGRGED